MASTKKIKAKDEIARTPTPGPWHAKLWSVVADDESPIADCCPKAGVRSSREMQLNAELIAAAPELLAACKNALELIDNRGNLRFMESAALLKHAIAKAEHK